MNDNQIVEKVISVITHPILIGHTKEHINFAQVYLKQIELEGLTYNQWISGIGILMVGKYLIPTTEEIMEEYFEKSGMFEKLFPDAKEDYAKLSEKEKNLFDSNIEKSEQIMTSPTTPEGLPNINGQIISSGPIGTYKILKDLRKLKEEIQNGFDVKYIAQNISYNNETKILSFQNMDIEIQPTKKPNKHHDLLCFLKKNGFEDQYSFQRVWESEFFIPHHSETRNQENIEIYTNQLNNRIEKITEEKYNNRISDFLVISEQNKRKYLQVNSKYIS